MTDRAAFEAYFSKRWPPGVATKGAQIGAWDAWQEAVRLEREAMDALLRDLRWRMDDIRDMLMKEGIGGNRIYGCDEWSTPTVNLQRAIEKIDAAIRARSEL